MCENSILHELYVFSEWKPEPEYLQKPDNILPERLSALWRWVKFFGAKKSLIDSVNAYKKKLQKWQIALGDEGKVIAVVTDNILEIRTKRSEYATIAARTTVARDPYSQWRKVVWSPDCSFIVLAYGNGVVGFFDLTASNLFNIPFECSRPGGLECTDTTHSVANIIFMPLRVKDPKWNWEVLIVSFDGLLRSFLVSQTDGFKLHNSFRFPGGVGAVAYCEPHNTLYVAGVPHRNVKDPQSPLTAGLTAWRVLNDEPYYKLSVVSDELEGQLANNAYQLYIPFLSVKNTDFVIRMEVSPDHSHLVCVHCNGDVSLWHLPRLRLQHRFRLVEQPDYNCRNPLSPDVPDKDVTIYSPVDVDWWSNQEIILSRYSGAVAICKTEDMTNILGQRPEFFQGTPQITRAYEGTFMALECESNVLPAKRSSDESMEVVKVEEESEQSVLEMSRELVKAVLYAITDMEAFQPQPRRVTVVARVYRLLGVRSTTPAELFARQIESGRYHEALALAGTYSLDSDLVYQQQWRKHPVSTHAIQNYLSKVAKKIWAVHQCVDRLPESLPAAKELLQFGLELTNEKILEEINKDAEEGEEKSLDDITLGDLNAYTSELLRCRHVMLFYRQRLALYEAILRAEKSSYTKDEYHRLRSNNLVHSASEIAKEGRIEALTCLWPNLKTIDMQLVVLDNLPETIDPLKYQHLLPTVHAEAWFENKSPIKVKPTQDEKDWCKKEIFRSIWSSNWSEESTPETEVAGEITESEPDVSAWYAARARDIEKRSGLASHALTLLRLAAAGGVKDLESLTFHLLTLDTLVYDVNLENVPLASLEKMPICDTCSLLMSKSTPQTFVTDLKQYVLPFLKRYEEYSGTQNACVSKLAEYLKGLSADDLTYILLVMKAKDEFELSVETQLELVETCLFAYNGTDQLDLACDLLDLVLKDRGGGARSGSGGGESVGAGGGGGGGGDVTEEVVARVGALSRLVAGSSRLAWRGVRVPLAALRDRKPQPRHALQLLTALARSGPGGNEKPTQQDWEGLLKDMLELQSIVFDCVSVDKCHEIYALALMTSGSASSVKLAAGTLATLPRAVAAKLALDAAREYCNSAASLADPALDLARCCLDLIHDVNPKIEEEREFLSALKILHSFNLEMLPVQVRLCSDKLQLIALCLESEAGAYLAAHKLLELANKLRVADDDEHLREGLVLQLVGERAWRASVAGEAAGAASARAAAARLAALRHAAAAPLLARVAAAPTPADAAARRALLAAALAHCDASKIEEYLRIRLQLQVEGLQAAGRARPQRSTSTDDEFADAITTPVIENKDLVAPPSEEKKPLFNYLLDAFQNKFSLSSKKPTGDDPSEHAVHCQEFYHSLYPEHRVSDAYYRYDRFSLPDALHSPAAAGQAMLGWYYTHNCLEDSMAELETEVVQRCGYGAVFADTALGVACLLRAARAAPPPPAAATAAAPAAALAAAPAAAPAATAAAPAATAAAPAATAAAPAATAAALYAALLHVAAATLADEVYLTPPKHLVQMALKQNIATEEQLSMIRTCLERLNSVGEVGVVRSLGLKVNALLFNADPDYRTEIIYRLAKSPGGAQWEAALALARRHALGAAELWLARAARPPPLSLVSPAALPPDLLTPEFCQRVRDTLWPEIPGNDHAALITYFSVIKNIDEKLVLYSLTAADHIKLLKKAKAASPDLNYKLLLEQPSAEELSQHILSIIKPESLGLLIKFLRTLPPALKAPVAVNQIYTNWLTKYFFSVGGSGGAATSKKWMQQYRQCASYFNKLAKPDLLRFVENACFTPDALARIPSGTRNLMIMQAVDYCQQEQENDFKISKKELSWSAVGQELTRWARFLENYHSDAVRALRQASDLPQDQIWSELEMSHGEVSKVRSACGELVVRGALRASALTSLLHCLHVTLEPHAVLQHALTHCVHTLQDMETLVMRLTQYHKDGVGLPEELLQEALEKASELGLPPHKQLGLLALSQRTIVEQDGDDMLKVARSTVDLFRTEWPEYADELNEDELMSEEGRRRAFQRFAARCDCWPRRKALAVALSCWPPARSQESRSIHSEYLDGLLRSGAAETLLLIKTVLRRPMLDEQEVKWLADNVEETSVVNALWIILLSKCDHSDVLIRNLVLKHKEAVAKQEIEHDLVIELLDQGLFTSLVSTPLYVPIRNFIGDPALSDQRPKHYTWQWAAEELLKANFVAEAAQLQMLCRGVPSSLRTFTQGLQFVKKRNQK